MKNSLAKTLIACTLLTTSLDLCAHTSGAVFSQAEWNEWVSAQQQKNDVILLKDGKTLQGTITSIPSFTIAGNSFHFNPDQLSLITTGSIGNASKIQWITVSGHSFISDVPNETIVLKGSDTKIPLQSVDTITFHNPSKSSDETFTSVELYNGDAFPIRFLNATLDTGRGAIATSELYDVLLSEGLHGTLQTDGKLTFIPHTIVRETTFHGQVPSVSDIIVFNWKDVDRIQSGTNGFIDKNRAVCQDTECKTVTPGIYTVKFTLSQNVENDDGSEALDPMLAGAYGSENEDTQAEKEKLYEQIYLSQLYEELQLMSDYDEMMAALEADDAKKEQQAQVAELQHDHDYHELMGAYSYHLEYERLSEHLAYQQLMADYDELMDALAFQDIDPATFDIRFSSESAAEKDTAESPEDAINFAKLSPEQQQELQEQMEHGELAEVTRILGGSNDGEGEAF